MSRNKCSLWTFFKANAEKKVGVCKICNKRISYDITTSNLKQHLKLIHRDIYMKFFSRSLLENFNVSNSDEENVISDDNSDTTKIVITTNSDIWDVFEAIENTKTAICFICNNIISYKSNTATLKQHLKLKHLEVYNLIVNKLLPTHGTPVEDHSSEGEDEDVYLETNNSSNSRPPSPVQDVIQNASIENNYEIENLQQDNAVKSLDSARKCSSPLWQFFNADYDTKIGECNLCKKKISFKSTIANLKHHLKSQHVKAYNILDFKKKSLILENLLDTEPEINNSLTVDNSQSNKEYIGCTTIKSSSSLNTWAIEDLLEECSEDNSSKPSRKRRSVIWQHFKGNHITQVAQCNLCQNKFSFKSTLSNLKQHLRLKHYKAYIDLISKRSLSPQLKKEGETSPKNMSKPTKISSALWDYFEITHLSHVAKCILCKKNISFESSILNLKQHLRWKHYEAYNKVLLKEAIALENDNFVEDNSKDENLQQDNDLYLSYGKKRIRSDLWNYFVKNEQTTVAKCNRCPRMISYKSTTSNLAQHLRMKHHEAYLEYNLKKSTRVLENDSVAYSSEGNNSPPKTQQLDSITEKSPSPLQNDSVVYDYSIETTQQDYKDNVWLFFKRNSSTQYIQCNLCQESISYRSNFDNLKTHLKAKHMKVYSEFVSRSASPQNFHPVSVSKGEDKETPESLNNIGIKSDSFIVSNESSIRDKKNISHEGGKHIIQKLMPERKKTIDRFLLKIISEDFQPLSIVEDSGFKQFVAALNPSYELPNRKSLAALLTDEYIKILPRQQKILQRCLSISLSLDCWTSRNMQNYMAIIGHFVDQDTFKLCTVLIECTALSGLHTADSIASELRHTANAWGIMNKINFIVSDNASNMVAAARLLNWPHFGCYARKFNLIVQGAINDVSINSIVEKVQKTVTYFKKNHIAKQMLREYQVCTLNVKQPKSLLLSVPTHWISVFLMLKRFSELKEALCAIFPSTGEDVPIITLEEWECLDQIVQVLKPFEEATTIMSSEGYFIASKAVVLTSGLYTVCKKFIDNGFSNPVIALILKLKNGLTNNFKDIDKNKQISICTLLDPRFKQHAFKDEAAVLAAKQNILDKFHEIDIDSVSSSNHETSHMKMVSSTEQSTLWESFDMKVASLLHPEITEQKTLDELNTYMSENAIPRTECPIQWWKEHKIMYPILSKIFVACFNTVVTSLSCDKVFSNIGHTVLDRRTRLTTSKVEKLMFLHVNK